MIFAITKTKSFTSKFHLDRIVTLIFTLIRVVAHGRLFFYNIKNTLASAEFRCRVMRDNFRRGSSWPGAIRQDKYFLYVRVMKTIAGLRGYFIAKL